MLLLSNYYIISYHIHGPYRFVRFAFFLSFVEFLFAKRRRSMKKKVQIVRVELVWRYRVENNKNNKRKRKWKLCFMFYALFLFLRKYPINFSAYLIDFKSRWYSYVNASRGLQGIQWFFERFTPGGRKCLVDFCSV